MLRKHAETLHEQVLLADFWDFLVEAYGDSRIMDLDFKRARQAYFGINDQQLEQERRQLLEATQVQTEQPSST